jgi:hypothetical protein
VLKYVTDDILVLDYSMMLYQLQIPQRLALHNIIMNSKDFHRDGGELYPVIVLSFALGSREEKAEICQVSSP